MKRLAILLILIGIGLAIPTYVNAKTPEQIFEIASPGVVTVTVTDSSGEPIGIGSGVVTGNGVVVTNWHVVKDGKRFQVNHSGKTYRAIIKYSDPGRDLCELGVDKLSAKPVTLGSLKTLKAGQRVYAIGSPRGLELTISEGLISSLRPYEMSQVIQTTAAISPGSSGGGLFDAEGRLVGITTFYVTEGQNLNFALPVDWIKELPKRSKGTPGKKSAANSYSLDWLYKALVLQDKQDWQGLLEHCKKWIKAENNNADPWSRLGFAYINLEQYPEALEAFREAIRLKPDDAGAWSGLGLTYYYLSNYPQAIKAHREAIRLKPDRPEAWLFLGETYYYQGANETLKRAGKRNRGGEPIAEFSQAIDALREAIRLKPDWAHPWMSLGNAYDWAEQYPQAIDAYRKAIQIEPDNAEAWEKLGVVFINTEQYPQAIEALREAVRLKPDYATSLQALGLAYNGQGNRAKVLEIYQKLRQLNPSTADTFFKQTVLPE